VKVYISCDMEGTTGVVAWDQVMKGRPEFEVCRRLLLGDVNAAIEGAVSAGAGEVVVADMHDGSLILPTAELHPAATYVVGIPHDSPRFPYLDDGFSAMFLVAYHAMAGTYPAALCHTMTDEWEEYAVNGTAVGEVEIDAALAGAVGVPVALVTGDQAVCAEARRFLGPIETVEVKQALDPQRALCLPKERTWPLIREAAARAVKRAAEMKPFAFGSPVEIRVRHRNAAQVPQGDGERSFNPDPWTIAYRYDRFEEHYGGVWRGR
jgi:D-amino peptidase